MNDGRNRRRKLPTLNRTGWNRRDRICASSPAFCSKWPLGDRNHFASPKADVDSEMW